MINIYPHRKVVETAAAILRCLHALGKKEDDYLRGYHAGKAFAYCYFLSYFGYVDTWHAEFRDGVDKNKYVIIWETDVDGKPTVFLMKRQLFEDAVVFNKNR